MTNNEKDAICQLWIEIFGTQEGVGYTCTQGAYQFAEVDMAYEREQCAKVADGELMNTNMLTSYPPKSSAAWNIAAAILARGEK